MAGGAVERPLALSTFHPSLGRLPRRAPLPITSRTIPIVRPRSKRPKSRNLRRNLDSIQRWGDNMERNPLTLLLEGGGALMPAPGFADSLYMAILRSWRNRSWFTDPAGWAEDALTSRSGYLSFIVLCLFGGAFCCAAIWIPASRSNLGLHITWGLYAFVLLFATVLPILYLRAARSLLLQNPQRFK